VNDKHRPKNQPQGFDDMAQLSMHCGEQYLFLIGRLPSPRKLIPGRTCDACLIAEEPLANQEHSIAE